jgi:hypothetical protein
MRKQYHLWPTANGFDAWDVDRLIELSADHPVEDVDVADIAEVDRVYWFNGSSDQPTVRKVAEHAQLIAEVDPSHPIILGPDGRVMDGMHRIARALLDGRPVVRAVRLASLPEPDYYDCQPDDLPYDEVI